MCIGEPKSGKSQVQVMEYTHGINYINIAHFLEEKGILHTAQPDTTK